MISAIPMIVFNIVLENGLTYQNVKRIVNKLNRIHIIWASTSSLLAQGRLTVTQFLFRFFEKIVDLMGVVSREDGHLLCKINGYPN